MKKWDIGLTPKPCHALVFGPKKKGKVVCHVYDGVHRCERDVGHTALCRCACGHIFDVSSVRKREDA